ncbi:tripartite ATP-independent transporter solute receptor, DctP family [Lutimaribacter pacificus]|uniref:Tripartite ATP-independent transporter solute receptor, DctP family n=1 Tax=Lutimaribacter pacificus TaxID=391948 RepID=A0A1H0IV31_9RHOB|nr:TRAP transporter substrate-binding protein [Lutimaribacter pacificus]SDO35202.1 tripartite ATP-independent transporter solute receptor, DctP family [Lutimaribacter pacificus]SHK17300.1 tripartite ATP-independent transporter solute receptor, DctP family [Lutimaribacter pacificus]
MTSMFRNLATVGALTLLAAPAAAQTEVKIGYALAPDSHYGVAAQKLEEVVLAETGDQFAFRHFPSSGLGGEREVIEGLQIGTVEATIVSSGTLANFVSDTGVFDIPFLFRDLTHARTVLDGPIGQEILAKFDDVGLHALAWGEQGFRHITNNRNAIEHPQDVQGLKIRTMENPVHLAAFEAMGAAPTPMAWPEVVSSLQQGVIDGQENPLSVIVSVKLNEVQKYLTLSGHVYSPAMLLVSKPFWEGLDDDQKAAFEKAATEAVSAMRAYVDNVETSGVETLKERGMEVGTLSAEEKAEFQAAIQSAYEGYYETYGKELVDAIVATE